ncbi:hypothetical protein BH23GEM10_BH23GEM10_03860 [soil metagenome]
MDVVRLTASDCRLLRARWAEHDNSQRRMMQALTEAGSKSATRLDALRRIEKRFDLDLAEICYRHARRNDAHPIERLVLEFIAEERHEPDDTQLWILPGNVRQVRELMDGKLVGDRDS